VKQSEVISNTAATH